MLIYSHRPIFMSLGKLTESDNNESAAFESDPADMRILIRINPEIWIGILDHLDPDALAEVCAL